MKKETLELEKRGEKRVRFGNEMEKLEKAVIKHCRFLRVRADKKALRRKVRGGVGLHNSELDRGEVRLAIILFHKIQTGPSVPFEGPLHASLQDRLLQPP